MKKGFWASFFETLEALFLSALIVLPIRIFIFQPFLVQGASMEPTFSSGDYLLVDEISFRFREPQRGEVVIFKYPINPSQKFIKRIIGLPGETVEIEDGKVFINGKLIFENYLINFQTAPHLKITLKEDEYFLLGDNRTASLDSRVFGPVKRKEIVGRAWINVLNLSIIPYFKLAILKIPNYFFYEQN